MELFWQQGYAATSMEQLVAAMGISRQSLYDTYGDKHALFLAALDSYCAMLEAALLAPLKKPGAGLAELHETAMGLVDFILRYPRDRKEHTSELQSLMRISYAVFCLKKKKIK